MQTPRSESGTDLGVRSHGDLSTLVEILWRGRRALIVACIVSVLVGVAYAVLSPKWYRSEVLLLPAKDRSTSSLASQFGGLASLAGISLPRGEDAEPMAVLKSRGFAADFIERHNLTTVLLAGRGRPSWMGFGNESPDIRDAVTFFDKRVRRVTQDRKTGLVTLAVEWTDPSVAAQWARMLADALNERMRSRAIAEASENIEYLRGQLDENSIVALQQPISKLLEMELQKLMLARSNFQYAFRVVDTPEIAKRYFRPRLLSAGALSFLFGALFGTALVLGRAALAALRGAVN